MLLKGNHEDYALRFLSDPALLSEWKNVGGLNTILSYGVTPPRRDDSAIAASAGNCPWPFYARQPSSFFGRPCALVFVR